MATLTPFEISDSAKVYFNQLLPKIEKLSISEIPNNSTFIGAAGFEDRGFSFIDIMIMNNKKFKNVIGIEYKPYNERNKTKEFNEKILNLKIKNYNWLTYDRYDPEQFYQNFKKIQKEIFKTKNVIIDISSMSKFLIIVLLDLLEQFDGNVHIIYSEAAIYFPKREEYEKEKEKLPESAPTYLTKDVYKLVTTPSLSSCSMQGYPILAIAFPTFNNQELVAILNEITPQYLINIEGIPHKEDNLWRLEAVRWINRKIENSLIVDIKKIQKQEITTFDYISTAITLDALYKIYRYSHKVVVAPTGSKLQTIGVYIFKQMHPEIPLIYPIVKDFAEEFTQGYSDIWHLVFNKFGTLVNKLSEHRQFHVKQLENKIKLDKNKLINILHLSDIHFGTKSDANKYFLQLETDLVKHLDIKKIEYLIISGDIANYSLRDEYDAAVSFINDLKEQFNLDLNRIIIVPGNHDLNWDLSKQAYPLPSVNKNDPSIKLIEGQFIPDKTNIDLVYIRDDEVYKKRFDIFGHHFFNNLFGSRYPIEYSQQGIVYKFPEHKIIFLALNSSWEIDHYELHQKRASINMDALSSALHELINTKYDDWLKIGVWHHPVYGPEMIKNYDFLELLSVHNFRIGLHGHIHEAIENYHQYDASRGIRIIGAGTFGAPITQQTPGIPLQYNLLRFDPHDYCITVETRRRESPDGAWFADARWGDKCKQPDPRYIINLK